MSSRPILGALWIVLLAGGPWSAPRPAAAQQHPDSAWVARLKAIELGPMLEPRGEPIGVEPSGAATAKAEPAAAPPFRAAPEPARGRALPASPDRVPLPNVRVNDRSNDAPGCGQSEVSIAASGSRVVAVWNDGVNLGTDRVTPGYAWSLDQGATWSDGGMPPVTGGVGIWSRDPVIAVNERTGAFYMVALCEPTATTNGVALVKGTVVGGVLAWGTPRVLVSGNDLVVRYGKPWLAADSTSGNLYVVYTRLTLSNGANRIDYQRSTDDNLTWSAPATLSSPDDFGRLQAPRIAAGPDGVVWAAWKTIGTAALDFIKVRRSTNQGAFFAQERVAASLYTNFGSGAPGYNATAGPGYPSLAVDGGLGPHRGRAWLAWNESINFYGDPLGTATSVVESEPNDAPGTATPFAIGDVLSGLLGSSLDVDDWTFGGVSGQTVILFLDNPLSPALDAAFRLTCADGTQLAYTETASRGNGLIVFTLPATGAYTLHVQPYAGTGSYTIYTGLHGAAKERARDHRDVFACWSDDGLAWSEPVRVNDGPARFDDWLPEIAVAGGEPCVLWYDWRDAPAGSCGGASSVYLARSEDGGATWTQGPVTDVQTAWTGTVSNIVPNQGDYLGLYGNARGLYLAWADGRLGDPDVFATATPLVSIPLVGAPPPAPSVSLAIESVHPNPAHRELWVSFSLPDAAPATLELLDVAGRRLIARAVRGGGRETVDLAAGKGLASGVYLVRLRQGGQAAIRRVSVVR